MVLLALACTGPQDTGSGPTCPPAPGEVLRLETGQVGTNLDAMLRSASGLTTLCLGGGVYETSLQLEVADGQLPGSITLLGTDDAVLDARLDDSAAEPVPFTLITPGDALVLQDLTLRIPLRLSGREVTLRNVTVQDAIVEPNELDLAAVDLLATGPVEVDGLSLSGLEVQDQGLRVEGETVRMVDLTYRDVRSVTGAHVEITGALTAERWAIQDTLALLNEPGHPVVSVFGSVDGGQLAFTGNEANGPALSSWSRMDLEDVSVVDHRSTWTGGLTVFSSGSLSNVELAEVRSPEGALAFYPTAPEERLTLADVTFGVDEAANDRCDISLSGTCQHAELGVVDEMICETSGCR